MNLQTKFVKCEETWVKASNFKRVLGKPKALFYEQQYEKERCLISQAYCDFMKFFKNSLFLYRVLLKYKQEREEKMFKGTKAKIKNITNIYAYSSSNSKFQDSMFKRPQEENETVL